jgi:hypothetical protein
MLPERPQKLKVVHKKAARPVPPATKSAGADYGFDLLDFVTSVTVHAAVER